MDRIGDEAQHERGNGPFPVRELHPHPLPQVGDSVDLRLLQEAVPAVERDCGVVVRDDHEHVRRSGPEPTMELVEEPAADSRALPVRIDVDPVELGLRAVAVVVQEAHDRTGLLGHEEVRVPCLRGSLDALAQSIRSVGLLHDAADDGGRAERPVGVGHGPPSDRGDAGGVGRFGLANPHPCDLLHRPPFGNAHILL